MNRGGHDHLSAAEPSWPEFRDANRFAGYAYSYPHKTSYRWLDPPQPLREVWKAEPVDALFLYTHLPFCEFRCGFCNLFTTSNPEDSQVRRTMDAIFRQSLAVRDAIQPERIAKAAFGGGTPTWLDAEELNRLFEELAAEWPVDWQAIPVSFEASPGTVDREKLNLLLELGVDRLSMGVQSFHPSDLKSLGRPFRQGELERACSDVMSTGFPVTNLDLIYGAASQSSETWRFTLERTLEWQPVEIYLYPLYIREFTGLGRRGDSAGNHRLQLYREGRDYLLGHGYEQLSMRLFRRSDSFTPHAPDYCCQEDGMIGLGPGARSYTSALHYSSDYAVGQAGVQAIMEEFQSRRSDRLAIAEYGVMLNGEERARRYLIKSLLRHPGLDCSAFEAVFGMSVWTAFGDELSPLLEDSLISDGGDCLQLTPDGFEHSDVIGPWLYSPAVRKQMASFEIR